jgi:hypothetical protein
MWLTAAFTWPSVQNQRSPTMAGHSIQERLMKQVISTTRQVLISAALLASAGSAMADVTLLGDTLSFRRAYPDTFTQFLSAIPDTVVTAGTSDQVSWIVGNVNYATFDPEALQIRLTLGGGYGGDPGFDGYVISGFGHDITSFTLANATGYSTTLSLLDARTLAIDLFGLSSGAITIGLTLAPVPEPASTAMMAVGLGLLAVAARRRVKRSSAT